MNTGKIKHFFQWMITLIILTLVVPLETIRAERKPEPKAEILQPKVDQELTGRVNVQLKLPARLSGPVYAGLGGPPWIKLEQVEDSNQYRGQLNSRMVPNGNQKLIVKTANKRSDVALNVKVDNPLKIYSSDFNTTSFNWWMETAAQGGQAKPETGNATSFNWWLFTSPICIAIQASRTELFYLLLPTTTPAR